MVRFLLFVESGLLRHRDTDVSNPDRLLSNPYAQPPLPSDWEVRPTYPVRSVPYFLAPMWDERMQKRQLERESKSKSKLVDASAQPSTAVPRHLREKLKRARGAKLLLQDLEEEVRLFVEKWNERQRRSQMDELPDPDSSDDEVVFIGRNGEMHDFPASPRVSEDSIPMEKLVFDSLEDDHGASFG